jgi:uncharacterized pyridoxamine 5'-phosphate oxidase family protein
MTESQINNRAARKMENTFETEYGKLLDQLGKAKIMVLATSRDNRVSARMMSCVMIDGAIYFQTDTASVKYVQLSANPFVALCAENVQIEGIAVAMGPTLSDTNKAFAALYQQNHKNSYDAYSHLKNTFVVRVTPQKIEKWDYIDGKPYQSFFDIPNQSYAIKPYIGE